MPEKNRDEDTGQYATTYSDEYFLNAIREMDGLVGTSEVAEYVDCSRKTAYNRLKKLEDKEQVRSRKVGHTLVWMIADRQS